MIQNLITANHRDAVNLIIQQRYTETIMLVGEPGVGKTAIGSAVAEKVGLPYVHINVPSKSDTSDFGMWIPDREAGVMRFMPNPYYKFDQPCVYNLDEFSKGNSTVLTMLLGLMEFPRRIGDMLIHPDSIVMATGNYASDGAGDNEKPHVVERKSNVYLRKSNAEEWVPWAINNNVNPIVCAWVTRNPATLASYYEGGADGNEMIFNPKTITGKINKAYVSNRSLYKAGHVIDSYQRGDITEGQMLIALQGRLGSYGARELATFVAMANEIPTPNEIIQTPTAAKIPTSPGATVTVVLGALQWMMQVAEERIDFTPMSIQEVVSAWFTYMNRLPRESQAMFIISCKNNGDPKADSPSGLKLWNLITKNKAFADWAGNNQHLFK